MQVVQAVSSPVSFIPTSAPDPQLNSDPAWLAFRFLSTFRFLGSAPRLGAGGAAQPPSPGPDQIDPHP